jgi:hypothetical protein
MLKPLSLSPSFGFGNRLGLATPGHIASVKGTKFAPIFAQQSIRENTRTGRTPQAELSKLPKTDDLPSLLEDFHAREVLHVTFGSALMQFGVELKAALVKQDGAYFDGLKKHFDKHLDLLK